jgi:hypothetical protein
MLKSKFQLNQTHWKYTVRTTNGLSEERLYDVDEDSYDEAFEGNDFDETVEDSFSIAA